MGRPPRPLRGCLQVSNIGDIQSSPAHKCLFDMRAGRRRSSSDSLLLFYGTVHTERYGTVRYGTVQYVQYVQYLQYAQIVGYVQYAQYVQCTIYTVPYLYRSYGTYSMYSMYSVYSTHYFYDLGRPLRLGELI